MSESPDWRMTDDGFLRCTARIQQEKILQYLPDEINIKPDGFDKDTISVYVPMDSLVDADAIKSLEGAPVVAWDHTWADLDVVKDVSIGSVAGTPKIVDKFLVCDLLITDKKTIEQIKSGDIGEISAAYSGETVFKDGNFDGKHYDAKQENLRYNHVAIIPVGTGRAGTDVRITNKTKTEEKLPMPNEIKMVRVRARNSKKYMNMSEDSIDIHSDEVENMEETIKTSSQNMDEMKGEIDTYKAGMEDQDKMKSRIQELEGEIAVFKQQIESMKTSDQQIEEAAMNMVAEQGEAKEIIENVDLVDDDGKPLDKGECDKLMNSIPNIHGDLLRKKILSAVGIKTKDMSSEAIKGAWSARKQIMNMKPKIVSGQKMLNQTMMDTVVKTSLTARQRLGLK